MLDQSLQSMLSANVDDISFQIPRSTTSRKLVNLLSSVRLYHDSIRRHANTIADDETAGQSVVDATRQQYDASLDYRILEALRNHSQHHSLPVHSYSVRSSWDNDGQFSNHEFEPSISVSELALNPEFKKTTMAEMAKGPDNLKLKPILRSYVEGLSQMYINHFEMLHNPLCFVRFWWLRIVGSALQQPTRASLISQLASIKPMKVARK